MIELIESMEELIHQQKSNWTIKYVIIYNLRKNHIEYSYHIEEA